ncbi:MAG: hypothetical protein RR328_02140, partial [Bacteroidales bacterium]
MFILPKKSIPFLKNTKLFFHCLLLMLFSCLLSASSCNDKHHFRETPLVYVNFNIYPRGIDNTLNYDGGFKYFDKYGYNGVFVYRLTSTEYLAYDR